MPHKILRSSFDNTETFSLEQKFKKITLRANTYKKHYAELLSNMEANSNLEGYATSLAFEFVSADRERERFKKVSITQLTKDKDVIIWGISPVTENVNFFTV